MSEIHNEDILVGLKPFMNYVTAVVMQFTAKNAPRVTIKARGKFISKAVDIAEVATKRFLNEMPISVTAVRINSEDFVNREGRNVRVSVIEIELTKTAQI